MRDARCEMRDARVDGVVSVCLRILLLLLHISTLYSMFVLTVQ